VPCMMSYTLSAKVSADCSSARMAISASTPAPCRAFRSSDGDVCASPGWTPVPEGAPGEPSLDRCVPRQEQNRLLDVRRQIDR
jgi:hypothetical protein